MLLLRWISALLIIGLIAAGGLWMLNHPGDVQLDWLGYRITTSFWVLAVALLLTLICGLFLLWAWLRLVYSWSLFGKKRQIDAKEAGLASLTDTLVALSLKDYSHARQHLNKSRHYLGNSPLATLLDAHIAARSGKDTALHTALEDLRTHKATEFLALSSLSQMATYQRKPDKALDYAKQAYHLRPDRPDNAHRTIGLLVKEGNFDEAHALVITSSRQKAFTKKQKQHMLAVLAYGRYQHEHNEKLLKIAFEHAADFPPAYDYITRLAEAGRHRAALKALIRAWKVSPHPALTDILLHYFDSEQPTTLLKRGQLLLKSQPDHIESHIAMARLAMQTKQWDMARNHLKAAMSISPQMRVYRLFSTLEERSIHDEAMASEWLKNMQQGLPDPLWHCGHCGHSSSLWQMHCEQCESFDSMVWMDTTMTLQAQPDLGMYPLATHAGMKKISPA